MAIVSKNPATDEVLKELEELSDEQVEKKLQVAQAAYEKWRLTSFEERRQLMKKLGELFRSKAKEYGTLMSLEMGKPMAQAIAESEKCGLVCDYYADNIEALLADEKVETNASESYVRFDPIGVVLAVMPWNYPFWQVMRFAAPAAMAGNVGILKHASNVPQCAEALEAAFLEAGFPEGVFQNLLVGSSKVEGIIQDPRVRAATLTGSEYAGSQVAMQCGKEIKRTVLELGGSDPFIVLDDADLDFTCEIAGKARLQNAGQSCIAAKRFIVMESVMDEFLEKFKAQFEAQVMGDPMNEATTIGPMSSAKARDDMHEQVQKSVEAGAEVLVGGKPVEGPGAFYEPTILTNVKEGMPAYSEEFFGPVALVISVKDEDEAIKVANATEFGLGASLWTSSIERAKKLIPHIDSGAVFVNGMVKSDPRLPFGGVKKSGYGRELSHYGIKEFMNVKTVWIK